MKLIILAAGKGKRMGESSNHTPKPILKYKGKTLIQHKLEQIPDCIDEIIIIIGHLGEKIVESVGYSYKMDESIDNTKAGKNIPITYIEQKELLGTGHALWQCKDIIGDSSFLVLMGDDLYSKEDLKNMCIKHTSQNSKPWVVLIQPQDEHISYGKCILDQDGYLTSFQNDPQKEILENYMYTGSCLLTPEVFNLPLVMINSTEYGLPQTFTQESRHRERFPNKLNIEIVKTNYWKRVTTPEDLVN